MSTPADSSDSPTPALHSADESHVRGTVARTLLNVTIGGILENAAQTWPDHEALVVGHQKVRYSYRALNSWVDQVARGLVAYGLSPGDRVGIWSPNCAEWVAVQFATARAGIILVNINPAYRLAELEFTLQKVGCRALIMASSFKSSDYVGMMQALAPEASRCLPGKLMAAKFPDLKLLVQLGDEQTPGFLSFAALREAGRTLPPGTLPELSAMLEPQQPINIQFTSGTTGLPKGATLTHFNIVNNGYFVGEGMRLTSSDRVCIPVPLYHCFGMVLGVVAAVTHGAAMIFPGAAFEPEGVMEIVAAERCTALYGVPTMFIAELEHPRFREFDFSSLRTGIMAGAPCPISVMRRVVDEMHMRDVTICYGMTETSPVSFQSSVDDPMEMRVSTVGRVHPHVEVKIVDEHGAKVARGITGELLTRGYSVMQGYWNDDSRTADAIDTEGWMHTGDLAALDEEGYCSIVGRAKDMIIRGGENIYPREIEEFLYRHPKVQEVAVVGVPDAHYGEAVCACIRLRDGAVANAEELRDFCQGQIAHFKIPRYVQFVSGFPTTVTGKLQKHIIREQMRELLSLGTNNT